MLFQLLLVGFCGAALAEKQYYHTFNNTVLSDEEYQEYVDAGIAPFCVIQVEDCVENEGRRLDGSCNNLKHPTMGASHTPMLRFLPPVYDNVDQWRKSQSGKSLPNGRAIRTGLLQEGRVSDQIFSNLVPTYWVFMAADGTFPQDTTNYMFVDPPCCSAEGKGQNKCDPQEIPSDDPVHRFSGVRCSNLTIPLSYQNVGCLVNGTAPERINTATPTFDISLVYGSVLSGAEGQRLYEGGLLRYEEFNGNVWPPNNSSSTVCRQNIPGETRCHANADSAGNSLFGLNLNLIWFWRQHNLIAKELASYNPCWTDEQLFYKARDINIAIAMQIYYYEMLPALLGKDNLLNDGVIVDPSGYRADEYDENVLPQITVEYLYILRWVHTLVEGKLKLYDEEGTFVKTFPIVNSTFRTGYLAVDNNLNYITQGVFRQAAGKIGDTIVDPDMVEVGLGDLLDMSDILMNDNLKSRYFGYPPYVDYRSACSGKNYTCFDDLSDVMEKERIELLKEVYEDVKDVDLMAGTWLESPLNGSYVPPTFYCIVVDQLKRNIKTDRHWYERKERPDAFTEDQLAEIRKASISRLLCSVGDNVTKIQPQGFLRPGPGNEIASCDETTQDIDLSVFTDSTCSSS